MAEGASTSVSSDVTSILSGFEQVVEQFVSGFEARMTAFGGIGQETDALFSALAAGGTSATALILQILVVTLVAAGVFLFCRRRFARAGAGVWRRLFATLAAAFIAIVAGVVAQRLLPAEGLAVRTLRTWVVVTVLSLVAIFAVRALLTHSKPLKVGRLASLARDLSIAIGWSMFGLAFMATLRLWGAGPGLRDALGSVLITFTAFALFIWTVWRHRRTLAGTVAGSKPRSRWQGRLARIWPAMVVGFLLATLVSAEVALTLGVPLPGATVLLTIVIVFLTPHLDALIASSANRAMEAQRVSIIGVALRQTARFAVLIVMITMLGAIWASPLATGFGIKLRSLTSEALHIALIAIAASFLWSVLSTVMGRVQQGDKRAQTDMATPRSRLGTLVPLISGVGKATIIALAFLSILVSVGVNVWPLITGLSVFGLAIGFGSQTLVKDIVSGLFFLMDDAFRLGEYIETSGAKGTVEKISVRSVTLRNPRGPVATVPYGQISKIQNFSRDYAIEKLAFRLAFDTDIELVRKLFKKIGQELLENPELAPDVMETFKSQGIANVEDGTLVVRGKFVAKPGKQSMIRRFVLKAVHQAFRENGIRVVPKPLTGDPVAAA
ncbi:mechanosensitive ion channel family protein [Mesorhizobium marinum]|uniref:mechanosensitive ion channel family protein n=1 Tax=Mesorhizobium marinum TaxID=3228790 RepID=UPI003466F663